MQAEIQLHLSQQAQCVQELKGQAWSVQELAGSVQGLKFWPCAWRLRPQTQCHLNQMVGSAQELRTELRVQAGN